MEKSLVEEGFEYRILQFFLPQKDFDDLQEELAPMGIMLIPADRYITIASYDIHGAIHWVANYLKQKEMWFKILGKTDRFFLS